MRYNKYINKHKHMCHVPVYHDSKKSLDKKGNSLIREMRTFWLEEQVKIGGLCQNMGDGDAFPVNTKPHFS